MERNLNIFAFSESQMRVIDDQSNDDGSNVALENIVRTQGGQRTNAPTNDEGLIFDVAGTNAWYERNQKTATFPYMCEFFKVNPL